jgi:thiol:disulfide interchange protein DsbC
MKKVLLSLSLVVSVFASDELLPQSKIDTIIQKTPLFNQIKSRFKNSKIKGVEKKDFYIITIYDKRGEGNFYVTKDLKYTILGQIIQNKTKKPLLADYPVEPFKGNKEIVKDGIVFSFGSGKKDLYVVTDPQCPFCQRFEKLAQKVHLSEKYKIHIIFLPLSFHKHSKDMIYYILSADSESQKAKRFKETLSGGDEWKKFKATSQQKQKIDAQIEKSKRAVEELGARGTPTFYDENFTQIKNRGKLFK